MSSPHPTLRIDPATGLLLGVRQVLSDHFEPRPGGLVPELIVIHGISLPPGQFGGPWIDRMFTGPLPLDVHPFFQTIPPGRTSAHALVRRDGEIVQYVPFHERAWHAGRSSYQGRAECNDYSIGIEMEGADGVPYEAAQYESLAALIKALLATYPKLSREHIAGHLDVSPGRKSDPWDFDWERLRASL